MKRSFTQACEAPFPEETSPEDSTILITITRQALEVLAVQNPKLWFANSSGRGGTVCRDPNCVRYHAGFSHAMNNPYWMLSPSATPCMFLKCGDEMLHAAGPPAVLKERGMAYYQYAQWPLLLDNRRLFSPQDALAWIQGASKVQHSTPACSRIAASSLGGYNMHCVPIAAAAAESLCACASRLVFAYCRLRDRRPVSFLLLRLIFAWV